MAALLLTHDWAKQQHIQLTALTVNHGLRPDAAQEAHTVATWCNQRNIAHQTLAYTGDTPKSNIQAWARDTRYQLMSHWCTAHGATQLILGHHMDDQAETILMRYMRGAGPEGLCGMAESRQYHNTILIRPLLQSTKMELIDYLNHHQQTYLHDPSNESEAYTRNRIRKQLTMHPNHKQLRARLLNIAKAMQPLATTQANARKQLAATITLSPMGYATMPLNTLKQADTDIATLTLMRLASTISGNDAAPRFADTKQLLTLLNTQARATFHGCMFEAKHDLLYIYRELNACKEATMNPFWDQRFLASELPTGYYVGAVGEAGWRSIKQQVDIDSHLPKRIFRTLPAIFSPNDLENPLCIPHIHYISTLWKLAVPTITHLRKLDL